MQNPQLAEIEASMQAIVRRAYDLGRTEALKKVVDVLSEERPSPDRLALIAPDDEQMHTDRSHNDPHAMNGSQPSAKPWWAWPVR